MLILGKTYQKAYTDRFHQSEVEKMAIVNTNQLADMMQVSRSTIRNWLDLGMPYHKKSSASVGRNAGYSFDTKDVIEWRISQALKDSTLDGESMTIEEGKRRKMAAEAEMVEIELAKSKGLVVDLEEVERNLSNHFAELASRLRKVPERVVMSIVGELDESKIKKIIRAEIDECLSSPVEFEYDE